MAMNRSLLRSHLSKSLLSKQCSDCSKQHVTSAVVLTRPGVLLVVLTRPVNHVGQEVLWRPQDGSGCSATHVEVYAGVVLALMTNHLGKFLPLRTRSKQGSPWLGGSTQ